MSFLHAKCTHGLLSKFGEHGVFCHVANFYCHWLFYTVNTTVLSDIMLQLIKYSNNLLRQYSECAKCSTSFICQFQSHSQLRDSLTTERLHSQLRDFTFHTSAIIVFCDLCDMLSQQLILSLLVMVVSVVHINIWISLVLEYARHDITLLISWIFFR